MNTELSNLADRLGVATGRLEPLRALSTRDVQTLDDIVASTMTRGTEAFGCARCARTSPKRSSTCTLPNCTGSRP